jgi:hypothetical protein
LLVLLPVLIVYAPAPLALALTILIEIPIVFGLAAMLRLGGGQASLRSCFINTLTQPALHGAMVFQANMNWWSSFVVLEIGVWIIEAWLYTGTLSSLRRARKPMKYALAISFFANLASSTIGLLLPT